VTPGIGLPIRQFIGSDTRQEAARTASKNGVDTPGACHYKTRPVRAAKPDTRGRATTTRKWRNW
jgi:hypothetical protein